MPHHRMQGQREEPAERARRKAEEQDRKAADHRNETGLEHGELPPPGGDPWHDGP